MNTLLEQLFERYRISKKDRHEIRQIFRILPDDKKSNLISNFEILAMKIEKIDRDIEIERKILVGEALITIDNILAIIKK